MELTIKQIIYAVLILLFIVVVVLFGPRTIRQLADALNLNIGIDPGELETQIEAKDITDKLAISLDSCVNPGELNRTSCFCLQDKIELPTKYSWKFSNEGDSVKMQLISDKSYKLKEYKINRANIAVCSFEKNKCYSDLVNGTDLVNLPPWKLKFEPSGEVMNLEIDDKYVFYYFFDSDKNKVSLLVASKDFAYDQIRKGTSICGDDSNISYTDEMELYLIQRLYK